MDSLVSTDWLQETLGAADLRIVDSSWFLPGSGRDARSEYEAEHIPGAVFLDLDEVSDRDDPLPHMVPPAHVFASRMQSLGIGDGNRIVVYDNSPLHSSARAWWMLKAFGAHHVAILDGGLQKWKAEARPVESGRQPRRHGHFTAAFDPSAVIDKTKLRGLLESRDREIVDARSSARFAGAEAEPRPGLAAGHIPGSKNLPQGTLFTSTNEYKQGAELQAAFAGAGVDLDKPIVASCGSGITACVLLFGAHLLGRQGSYLYDGSWAEWGADPELPKAKGSA